MWKIGARLNGFEPGQFRQKLKIFFVVISVALSLLVMRLWYLQVVQGDELRQRSESATASVSGRSRRCAV
jgi:cell division protein FtsI/penicillin-binding protein 2